MQDDREQYQEFYDEQMEVIPQGIDDIPHPEGGAKEILKLGATLIAYPIVIGILEKIGKPIGGAMSRGLASKIANLTEGGFARAFRPGASIGETLTRQGSSNPIQRYRELIGRAADKRSTLYDSTIRMQKARSFLMNAAGERPQDRVLRGRELFQNMRNKEFMRGAAIRHAQSYMGRSLAFYGAERVIGAAQGRDNAPPLWNVPGTVADYAKFTAGFYPVDVAFMGGGKFLTSALHRGVGSAHDVIVRNSATLAPKAMKGLEKVAKVKESVVEKMYGLEGGWRKVSQNVTWKDVFNFKFSSSFMRPSGMMEGAKLFQGGWLKSIRDRKAMVRRTASLYEETFHNKQGGYSMTSAVGDRERTSIADFTKLVGSLRSGDMPAELQQQLGRMHKIIRHEVRGRQKGPSTLEYLFGLEKATIGETSPAVAEQLSRAFVHDMGNFRAKVQSRQIRTRDFFSKIKRRDSVYKSPTGQVIDLRPLDITLPLKQLYQRATAKFPLNIIGGLVGFIPRLAKEQGPLVKFFDRNEAVHVGGQTVEAMRSHTGIQGDLGLRGLWSPDPLVGGQAEYGLFFAGDIYKVTPNALTRVNAGGPRRFVTAKNNSALQRIMGRFYGYPGRMSMKTEEEMGDSYGWGNGRFARARKWLHKNVFRKIEIGAGFGEEESVIQHLKGMTYGKYLWPHSPQTLYGDTSRVFSDNFLGQYRGMHGEEEIMMGVERRVIPTALPREHRTIMEDAVNQTKGLLGRMTVDASDVVVRKMDRFRHALNYDLHLVDGTSRSPINVGRAMEDDYYLWQSLQMVSNNIPAIAKNEQVAATIMDIQGKTWEQFKLLTAGKTAKGFSASITKLDELKHFLLGEAIAKEGSGVLENLVQAANDIGVTGRIGDLNQAEYDLVTKVFGLKKSLSAHLVGPGKRSREELLGAVEAINSVKQDMDTLVRDQIGGISKVFSSGHIPNLAHNFEESDITGRIRNAQYVSIPASFPNPTQIGWKNFAKSFFPSAYGEPGSSELELTGAIPMWLSDRFARVGGLMDFAPDPTHMRSSRQMFGTFMKWGAAITAGSLVYSAADTFFDVNPMFKGTPLDEGITVAGAEQIVKARMLGAGLQDITGVTGAMQYMEGLMPGSVQSTGARMARGALPMLAFPAIGFKLGGHRGAAAGALMGMTAGIFGFITDERKRDQLIEEYSGRKDVAVRKGRWWELGRAPFRGQNVDYFRPNWFARLKAQPMQTPDALGSKLESSIYANPPLGFNPLGALIDPYHYERKHYLSRPFPEAGGLGEEVPFIGPLIASATSHAPRIGPLRLPMTKPGLRMHSTELARASSSYQETAGGVVPGYFTDEFTRSYEQQQQFLNSPGTTVARGLQPTSATGLGATLGAMEYRGIIEPLGLVGFGWEAVMGKLQGKGAKSGLMEPPATYESSSWMNSFGRQYWNLNMGGLMGLTEFWRRFIPRRQYDQEYVNPISNRMPRWVNASDRGIDFTIGDPYSKISEGELRLPGRGYESMHNVRKTFPEGASILGYSMEETVERLLNMQPPLDDDAFDVTTTGTYLHKVIQQQLGRENMLVAAEKLVYDPYSDLEGYIDAIVKKGGERQIIEIKTIAGDKLKTLSAPRSKHYSQINFYMRAEKQRTGTILYVSRDDPRQTKAFDVYYSENKFKKDLAILKESRMIAAELAQAGEGFSGAGYSNVDRMAILADIAPYSKQYKEALQKVRIQARAGVLDDEEIEIVKTAQENRTEKARRLDLYPNRFTNPEFYNYTNLFFPQDTYPSNVNSDQYIKPASEYSFPERLAGAWWEGFCLPGTELVETSEGYKPANKVAENDLVRTAKGNWKAVEKVWIRKPTEDDLMMIIQAAGHCIPLRTTVGHQIITTDGEKAAKDVKRGDWLLYPPIIYPTNMEDMDVTTMFPKLVVEKIDEEEFVRKKKSSKPFPRKLKKTQALWRFFGYYFARGGLIRSAGGNHGVRMGFANSVVRDDAVRTMLGLLVQNSSQVIDGYDYVKFNSPVLAMFVDGTIGDGEYKKIPDFILEGDDVLLLSFLKGLFMNRSFKSLVKARPDALLDISKLLLHFKIAHKLQRDSGRNYKLEVDEHELAARIGLPTPSEDRQEWLMTFNDDGSSNLWVSNARVDYHLPADLYDFTVFEDHTYCTGLFAVHNSHMDTPLHTRFLPYKSPSDEYERTRVYGRSASFWEHPYRDFIEPWTMTAVSSDTRSGGAAHGAFLGVLAGGPAGLLTGAYLGGMYGGTQGTYFAMGGKRWIPKKIEQEREMEGYFDKLEYLKAKKLLDLTGNPDYQQAMSETMTGMNPHAMNSAGWTNIFRAMPYQEKPFLTAFLQTTEESERKKIKQLVPADVSDFLELKWAQQAGGSHAQAEQSFADMQNVSKWAAQNDVPTRDWSGWSPGSHIEDVELKSIEQEGWDSHDFGLGWKDQKRRINLTPFPEDPIQMTKMANAGVGNIPATSSVGRSDLVSAINRVLTNNGVFGSVTMDQIPGPYQAITATDGEATQVTINISRKRHDGNAAMALPTAHRMMLNG